VRELENVVERALILNRGEPHSRQAKRELSQFRGLAHLASGIQGAYE